MLRELVEDPRYAWDRTTLTWDELVFPLSEEALAELERAVRRHGDTPDRHVSPEEVRVLHQQLAALAEDRLRTPGLFIVSGLDRTELPPSSWKAAFRLMVRCLGDFYLQDQRTLEVKEVRDRGLTLDDRHARYSDGRHGGGFHTDGAERALPVPDCFGLLCVSQGARGGAFQALSAYSVHDQLLRHRPRELDRLWRPFHFDLRGDLEADGRRTAEKPVFFHQPANAHALGFTYLRKYIDAAQAYPEVPRLGEEELRALDALDAVIRERDNPLVVEGRMRPGETAFVNNTTIIHGRTAFEDGPGQTRLLYRAWIARRR